MNHREPNADETRIDSANPDRITPVIQIWGKRFDYFFSHDHG